MSFFIALILARILMPEDFGTIAMITVFTHFGSVFVNFGLSVSLIQKKDVTERDLSTVFWLNLLIGFLMTLVFLGIAPLIAAVYQNPDLAKYTSVLALNFLLGSGAVVQRALYTKKVNFKTLTLVNSSTVLVAGIIGIACAMNGLGIWALVIHTLCGTALATVLLWILSDWRPKFLFCRASLNDMLGFSLTVLANKLVITLSQELDKFLLGRFVSAIQLGLYNRGESVMNFPVRSFSSMLSLVVLPVFSEIQEDDRRLRRSFRKMLDFTSFILFPLLVLLLVFAEDVVLILLTEKWLASVPFLQLFCLIGLSIPIDKVTRNILVAKGFPNLLFRLEMARIIGFAIGFFIGLQWGVYGVLVAKVLVCYLIFIPQMIMACRLIDHSFKAQGWAWLKILFINALLAVFLLVLGRDSWFDFLLLDLAAKSVLGLAAYLGMSLLIRLVILPEIVVLLRQRLISKKPQQPPSKS